MTTLVTMSTFNLQQGVEGNERSEPAPDSLILSIPRKPLVKLPQPVLYKEKPPLHYIPSSEHVKIREVRDRKRENKGLWES